MRKKNKIALPARIALHVDVVGLRTGGRTPVRIPLFSSMSLFFYSLELGRQKIVHSAGKGSKLGCRELLPLKL